MSIVLRCSESQVKSALGCLHLFIYHHSAKVEFLTKLWNQFSLYLVRVPLNASLTDLQAASVCRSIFSLEQLLQTTLGFDSLDPISMHNVDKLLTLLVNFYSSSTPDCIRFYALCAACSITETRIKTVDVRMVDCIKRVLSGLNSRHLDHLLKLFSSQNSVLFPYFRYSL